MDLTQGLHPNPHPKHLGSNTNLLHFECFPLLQPREGCAGEIREAPEMLQWLFQVKERGRGIAFPPLQLDWSVLAHPG